MLHGLVGYSAAPTVLQAILWALFLAVGFTLFLRPARRRRPGPALGPGRRGVTKPRFWGRGLAWLALGSVEC